MQEKKAERLEPFAPLKRAYFHMGSAVLVLVECIINYHNQAKALAFSVSWPFYLYQCRDRVTVKCRDLLRNNE
jgi:hypothetical protein